MGKWEAEEKRQDSGCSRRGQRETGLETLQIWMLPAEGSKARPAAGICFCAVGLDQREKLWKWPATCFGTFWSFWWTSGPAGRTLCWSSQWGRHQTGQSE